MRARAALVALAAALVAALPAAASAPGGGAHLYGLGHAGDRALQVPARGFTGGPVTTTNTGETLNVFVADSYLATDPEMGQRWADFLGGLLHGDELSRVTVYLAPLSRVHTDCGGGALACYDGDSETIFTIGTDLVEVTAASILMHEYGHHVANSRRNDPWAAIDYGTKRWASYVNVCKRAEDGELSPGDEGDHYEVNPGEGFAEVYRVLSERRAGLEESAWDIVDEALYPDDEELRLVEQDVLEPWPGNTATSIPGRFLRGNGNGRLFRTQAPYDGTLRVTLRSAANTIFELRLRDSATNEVLVVSPGAGRVKTLRFAVCGTHDFTVGVRRAKGYGSFTLTISKP